MSDIAFYSAIKQLHLLCIICSVWLFAARWTGVLANQTWPMGHRVRMASVTIDTALLAAGVSLWTIGGWHPWHTPWLGTKLLALVAYVLLGSWALKRAGSWTGRLLFGLAALGMAGYMVGVAMRHHPASWWSGWWLGLPA